MVGHRRYVSLDIRELEETDGFLLTETQLDRFIKTLKMKCRGTRLIISSSISLLHPGTQVGAELSILTAVDGYNLPPTLHSPARVFGHLSCTVAVHSYLCHLWPLPKGLIPITDSTAFPAKGLGASQLLLPHFATTNAR
jgi:hypothetical protein